jgi:lycopene cyclase domain-containing protein
MKYFGVLARFVIIPLAIFRFILWLDKRQKRNLPDPLANWNDDVVLAGHAALAVAYTTPWDNYLVAKKIWGYDPKLVTGLTIGWVPIEEYTFFVLQSLMTGSWWQTLARRLPVDNRPYTGSAAPRLAFTGALGVLWLASAYSLFKHRDNYMGLILSWALPPIMLQTAFGGDILWRHRKLVAAGIAPATAYLGIIDSLAIGSGTWKINPKNTLEVEVIKNLPIEEFTFFLLTNTLLIFGMTLVQAKESERRLPAFVKEPYLNLKARIMDAPPTAAEPEGQDA